MNLLLGTGPDLELPYSDFSPVPPLPERTPELNAEIRRQLDRIEGRIAVLRVRVRELDHPDLQRVLS